MSDEQLKAFQAAVEADAGLQEKVNGAGDDADAVVAIAKAAGFVITAEELIRAKAEISEDELAGVTGGVMKLTCSNELRCPELPGLTESLISPSLWR